MLKTQIQIIKYTLLIPLIFFTIEPVKAENRLILNNHNNSVIAQNNENLEEITDIIFNETETGLEITILTKSGKSLVPIILTENNNLIIELLEAKINYELNEINPTANITQITATTVNDSFVRMVITGKNNTIPQAEIIPTDNNLTFAIRETDATTAQNFPDISDLTITITGTRTPRRLLDSSSSIIIIDSQQIERQLVQDIRDLVRYEPGVSVGRNANRFGNQDFNIRGIDGNRVLLQVDGIRVPDNYVGRGRDYFNLETIKRVEIIKGPASALYGSDAIGGVVSFITKDPQDYLDTFDNSFYTSGQVTYDTADESVSVTGVIAGEDEEGKLQFSTVATYSGGSALKTASGVQVNPQDITDYSITSKLVYNFDDNNSLKLTGEFLQGTTDTIILNEIGTTPFNVRPPNLVFFYCQNVTATDTRNRNRFSLDYNYENETGWLQNLNAKFYYQNAEIKEEKISEGIQQSFGRGRPSFIPVVRDEVNKFEQDVIGGEVQLQSDFMTGSASHRLVYGLEVFNTSTSRPRDNTLIFPDGSISKFVIGEEFPNKTFPDTDTLRLGLYVQDEIEIGQFSIIPGIRWDYFSLNANEDDDFRRINVDNFKVENRNDSAFSPKIGIVYKPTPELALYGQYARGFRSPPYDDANIGFTNFAFGYAVLPNANLKPETSNSFEIGIRGAYPSIDFSLAGFYNDYQDFIDNVSVGTRESDGFSLFQSQNIDSAEIYGVEAKAEYFFNPTREDGVSIIASLAWAEGNNDSGSGSVPLNSVNPFEAVLGLRYKAPEDRWGTDLIGTFVSAKNRSRIDGDDLFAPNGYFLLDLLGYYNFSKNASLNVGLFNLFNSEYYVWSDVRGLTNDDPNLKRFAPPGFNAAVNFVFRF